MCSYADLLLQFKCDFNANFCRTIAIRDNILSSEGIRTLELIHTRLDLHGRTAIALFTRYKFLRELDYATVRLKYIKTSFLIWKKVQRINVFFFVLKFHLQALERLDELLKVFNSKEIAVNIKLLNYSVAQIKVRLAELSAIDPSNISPKICSMSETEFTKYKKAMNK